jgi:uncharacterized protein
MKQKISTLTLLLCIGMLNAYTQQSNPKLLFEEGYRYLNGINKPYDPGKAFGLFSQSAEAGYGAAMNALGNMYTKGLGTIANPLIALTWYKKASDQGYLNATVNLGRMYQKGEGVTQDFAEAFRYYRKGAEAGDIQSKNELAYFYYKGLGVEQNYNKAFSLYYEIAQKGNVNAEYFVGICYRNGYGVPADATLSKHWLQKAAAKQDRQAIHELNNEPLPENISTITPALQEKVASLKAYTERFIAAPTNNIEGVYQGYAVYYDFSKKYVHAIVPLTLNLRQTLSGYEGTWTESNSLSAAIKTDFSNNKLFFYKSSQYTRNDYYSYRNAEEYQFDNASLSIKYMGDSMYLSGDVRFYSLSRKEPGQPMYIALSKKIGDSHIEDQFKLQVSPNPASSIVKATFTLDKTYPVQIQMLSSDGKLVQQVGKRTLPAGTYSYDFNVQQLPQGTYLLRFILPDGTHKEISKPFIKI